MSNSLKIVHVKSDECVPVDMHVPAESAVILVWRGLPREGIAGAVATVRSRTYGAKARYVLFSFNLI